MASMGEAPTDALFKEMTTKLAEARDGDFVIIQAFDDHVDPPLYEGPASEIKLTFEEIRLGLYPRFMTALNDALANILIKAMAFSEVNPGHEVGVVIYTDGAENSSIKYSGAQGLREVNSLVRKACTMGIHVIFMAANIDVFTIGSAYGIPRDSCLQAGQDNFTGLRFASEGIRNASRGASRSVTFTKEQQRRSSTNRRTQSVGLCRTLYHNKRRCSTSQQTQYVGVRNLLSTSFDTIQQQTTVEY